VKTLILFCALYCFVAQAAEITYSIQTIAGSSLVGDGSSALNAQLSDAQGLAVDRLGAVYIADPDNHRVRKVTTAGIMQTVAGTGFPGFSGDEGPAAEARLSSPYGVAVDGAGNVYIADLGNNRVRRVSTDGIITTVAGGGFRSDGFKASVAQLSGPRNVAVDAFGNLYIAEFNGHRIRKVTSDGVIETVAGTGAQGARGDGGSAILADLAYPAGMTVDFTGALYVADSENSRIRRVFGGVITTLAFTGFTLKLPTGVCSDGAGGIYVADSGNRRVLRRTSAGIVFPIASGLALDSARDVATDGFGNLLIADKRRVRLLTGAGYATTLAGDGTFGFRGDGGPAALAVLNAPSGVAVDLEGTLYIADEQNHRVRKVSTSGVISTVAGTGAPASPLEGLSPTATPLTAPEGLFADPAGAVWIAEYFGNRVRKLIPGSAILTVAGNGAGGFNGDSLPATSAQLQTPGAAALSPSGDLYIADSGNNRIRKVTASGIITTFAGTGSPGYSGDGGQAASAQLNLPRGIAFDAAGNLYIADTNNNRIRLVTPGGLTTTIAGDSTSPLRAPRSVTVDLAQNLYIADTGNHRIIKRSASGELSEIAGISAAGFRGDGGAARSAQFSSPAAIAVDLAGNLFVADLGNNRIRKLIPVESNIPAPVTQLPKADFLHAASLREGAVAPGEILSIIGAGIGPAIRAVGGFGEGGLLPTLLSETQVLFNGRPAPLLDLQQNQIKVQVPYEIADRLSVRVEVFRAGELKAEAELRVTTLVPGVFTVSGGTGPAQVTNEDGSQNSENNPANPGSVVTLFATGEGLTTPASITGKRAVEPYPQPLAEVIVRIGGRPAEILFAASTPGEAGTLQINAILPTIVAAGAVPLTLTIGLVGSQDGLTVFVK
jgi:uncharacterized protein (TIGR03437 family)